MDRAREANPVPKSRIFVATLQSGYGAKRLWKARGAKWPLRLRGYGAIGLWGICAKWAYDHGAHIPREKKLGECSAYGPPYGPGLGLT